MPKTKGELGDADCDAGDPALFPKVIGWFAKPGEEGLEGVLPEEKLKSTLLGLNTKFGMLLSLLPPFLLLVDFLL